MGKLPKFHILYILSFIEGGALMAVELLGSKMIAPYFGASLYVWTAVLGTTLGGLALGYFAGGGFSERYDNEKLLFWLFLISGALLLLLPFYGTVIMESTVSMELRTGVTISSFVILTPVLMCFGMVSPLIINLLAKKYEVAGHVAGTVYAISTFGGVVFSLVFGLYFIPFIGIKTGTLVVGAMLTIGAVLAKVTAAKKSPVQMEES